MVDYPLWTALVTPMNTDGSVDFDSLEKILRKQEEADNGILILGSTGEGLNLMEEEKREVVQFAYDLDLSVSLMAGVGGFGISEQVDFMHYCDEVGVDAFLLVTPLYAKPGKEGQFEWFCELMAETETPCMLYNVPSRTGVKLHPSVPARIADEFDHLMGVKEASGSVDDFKAFREAAPEVPFYSGDDGMTEQFVGEGGVGLVSVASNIWPKATHYYLDRCLAGDKNALFPAWDRATDALFMAPNPIPVKVQLQKQDWIANDTVRLPLSLNDTDSEKEKALAEATHLIGEWYQAVQD